MQVESKARPRYYWSLDARRRNEGVLEVEGHVFRMVEGLWRGQGGEDAALVSFESVTMPGYYVCNRGGTIMVVRGDAARDEAFRRGCTFRIWQDRFFDGCVRTSNFFFRFFFLVGPGLPTGIFYDTFPQIRLFRVVRGARRVAPAGRREAQDVRHTFIPGEKRSEEKRAPLKKKTPLIYKIVTQSSGNPTLEIRLLDANFP